MFIRLLTSFLVGLLIMIIFEILYAWPSVLYFGFFSLVAILFFALWLIMGKKLKTPSSRFYLLIPPLFLAVSTYGFSLFVNPGVILHGLALGVAGGIVLYLFQVTQYLWRHENYLPFSLESISSGFHLFKKRKGDGIHPGIGPDIELIFSGEQ